jgi:hypothetical protein
MSDDSGVRVLPIVLRILPGSTSDTAPFPVKQPEDPGKLEAPGITQPDHWIEKSVSLE